MRVGEKSQKGAPSAISSNQVSNTSLGLKPKKKKKKCCKKYKKSKHCKSCPLTC